MTIYLLPMLLAENTHSKVLTPYSLEVIKELKVFFVENVKTTRRFISSLKLGVEIDELTFFEVNKDTPFEAIFNELSSVKENVGVISEAGCSGVADPGSLVVEAGYQLGFKVTPLLGPSSILLALMASGMNGQSFVFHGYLPIKEEERIVKIRIIEKEAIRLDQTQIFMETPYRNNQMLQTLLKVLQPSTRLCIACDLTSEAEFVQTKTIALWRKLKAPDLHKRPALFLIN